MALATGLTWTYVRVVKRKAYFLRVAQQLFNKASKVIPAGNDPATVSGQSNPNTFPSDQPGPPGQPAAPPIEASSQTVSPVLKQGAMETD
jgi:hypothetical protein